MIDLHSHILPGLDDGSPDLETSIEMARRAVEDGVSVMVATPHVNGRYMPSPAEILERVKALNDALAAEGIAVVVSPGAEVGIAELGTLDEDALTGYGLGGSSTLLVESPYLESVPFFDEVLFGVTSRGFRILLAHPERSPMFARKPDVIRDLVAGGVMCSVTAGSIAGVFGGSPMRSALELLRQGLVHNVSSDSHDLKRRPPGLSSGLSACERSLPGSQVLAAWMTESVPSALLGSAAVPAAPPFEAKPPRIGERVRNLFR